ncbi:MAG TPA: pyridoxal-phosphate dependent enzyme [Solirubrobacteraceae bacterium]|nr:pyridoxal-phosphate dependent enzyme [Solirubrobacteraceae bacterium]
MTRLLAEREPSLPHVELCSLPTPVRPLPRLADGLWMKDDSRTAPLWGGNKPRKLEWLIGDARRRGRRTLLTFGGLGTNHGLATALYAREHGMRCVLALLDQPRDEHVERQLARIHASGAHVYVTRTKARTVAALPWLMLRHGRAYFVPPGGSSPVGALGFVEAALELGEQVRRRELPEPATVWCALGSGGTAAGLALGLRMAGLRTKVCAVHVNDGLRLSEKTIVRLARRTPLAEREVNDVEVVHGWLGAGYGHGTPEAGRAIERARQAEDLVLDPVYTGKTMAALLDHIERGAGGPALYWHTYSAVGY